jgi:hypothetical protein
MDTQRPHLSNLLAIGLTLDKPFPIAPGQLLGPRVLSSELHVLEEVADSQRTYGLLCTLADHVTLELSLAVSPTTPEGAALQAWNAQWTFMLLSVVARHPIMWPFLEVQRAEDERARITLMHTYVGPLSFQSPKSVSRAQLALCKSVFPKFLSMVVENRFAHAVIVAAGCHREQFPTARVAAIWSGIEALLGLDAELNFRIAFIVAHLLGKNRAEREVRFVQTKKLYAARSKCVHGAGLPQEQVQLAAEQSLHLLCDLILVFAKRGSMISRDEQNGFMR